MLTEKALDCETHSISINTVADGKALAFMEAADLYALFAGMLDGAIGLVANLEPPDSRQIDVTVVQRRGLCRDSPHHAGSAGAGTRGIRAEGQPRV